MGAQRFKQAGKPLHFIENHESFTLAEQPLGRAGKRFPHVGALQIEKGGGAGPLGGDAASQGRLSYLPGAKQGNDRGFLESLERRPVKIGSVYLLNIHDSIKDIQQ